jgi:hypothetical protein
VAADVAEHEPHEIERVVVLGVELDRPIERSQRFLIQPAMVQHLAECELEERAVGIERERMLHAGLRPLHVAGLFLRERQLEQGADVVRLVLQEYTELFRRRFVLAEQRECATELPSRITVFRVGPQPVAELGYSSIVIAGVEVCDLEIATSDLHLAVELERFHERRDGLLVQSLVVVQDAEVVVRAGVRRIDPAGERPKYVAITLGRENHGQATRTALRMACSEAASGRSRK